MVRQRAVVRDAVQDLEHLEALSDAPDLVLLVSERTLYVLQNLAISEIANSGRYATELTTQGYVPVREEDPEYALFESCRDEAQLEILEVGMVGQIYGIADTTREYGSYQFPAGGDYVLPIATVPAGEKWQLEAVVARNINSVTNLMVLYIHKAGAGVIVEQWVTPPANIYQEWAGRITLVEGDGVQVGFFGCAANDNVDGVMWAAILTA